MVLIDENAAEYPDGMGEGDISSNLPGTGYLNE
jgi:hypothetical protein